MKLAQDLKLYEGTDGLKGFGQLGLEFGIGSPILVFTKFLSSTVGLISLIAVIWFIFTLILGAVSIITSGGDKNSMESAKKKITSGIIGLIATIVALFILKFVGFVFGIPDILNPTAVYEKLIIK